MVHLNKYSTLRMYSCTCFILLYVVVLLDRDTAQPRRCTRFDLHLHSPRQETETSLFEEK